MTNIIQGGQIQIECEHSDVADPNKLKPHPGNPNKHPKNQIRMLAKSIESYGWRHPIVISKRSGNIIAGHARREAAIQLGCPAPVDYQDFESDEHEIAVLLADNVLPELSFLDNEIFDEQKELLLAADIELESIGIEITDSDMIDGKDGLDGQNYTNVTGSRYPINFFGIGGFVPKEMGDLITTELERLGAEKGQDNSDIICSWLERVLTLSP